MKCKSIIILSLSLFLVGSCNQKKETSKKPSMVQEIKTLPKMVDKAKKNVTITDKLKELKPITIAEVEVWMPAKIGAMERTYYKTNISPGGVLASRATFKDPNNKQTIKITFMDGAGESGSMAISPYLNLERFYEERNDENGFQKIITRNDMLIVQKYKIRGDKFDLEFAPKNRYIVKIETETLNEEELWSAVSQFNFEKLDGI